MSQYGPFIGKDPRFDGTLQGGKAKLDEIQVKRLVLNGEPVNLRVEGTTLFIDVETRLGTLSAALPLDFKQEEPPA
jgi:hypothetical protein